MNKIDWKKIKKTDWVILALVGVLLLVIVLPESGSSKQTQIENTNLAEMETVVGSSGQKEEDSTKEYVTYLEERLEAVLSQMEGVGKVKVMITLSDYGESIVEKDTTENYSSITETDKNGGSRVSTEQQTQAQTVWTEDGSKSYPYVEKELFPTVEGVVVVAEGGGNSMVVSAISKAAMALFPIEAHKIIVVKMSSEGDKT